MSLVRAIGLTRTAGLLFGRIQSDDPRRRRLLGIAQGVVTGLGNKLVGMVVSFLSVPLTIGYLGREQYGAWVSIGAFLAWLSLSDFGLGNGLNNAITTAVGQDRPDLVRMHLSNGLLLLSGIAGVGAIIALCVWPFVDWSALFGVTTPAAQAEVGPAIAIVLAFFLMQFPLTLAGKLYLAYQEGRLGSYWGMVGNMLSLLALLVVTQTHGGLVLLATAVSGTGLLVSVVSNVWMFRWHRPELMPGFRHVDFSTMRALGHVGGKFFLIQIMALVTFQTDNLVIAHYLGSASVPEYSLTYTLFSYTTLVQSTFFSFLWSAYTEAIARKDIAWVNRTFHWTLLAGLLLTAVGVIALMFIAKPFIGWWAGPLVVPSLALMGWMGGWSMINAITNPVGCLLASASHLRNQIIYSSLSTFSNLILSIYLVQTWGVVGVIAATVISYAFFVCIPVMIDAERLLRRLQNAL